MEKKKLSGAENRKKRKLQDEENKKQAGQLLNFFLPSTSFSTPPENVIPQNLPPSENVENSLLITPSESTDENNIPVTLDLSDPNNWPYLNNDIINKIVTTGPIQVFNFVFPITNKRKFTVSLYERILANGDKISRSWLIYSITKDCAYCFCCLLFSKIKTTQSLSSSGCSDWSHINQILKSHENSSLHMECFKSWKLLESCLKKNETINYSLDKVLKAEVTHWNNVLRRLLIIVKFLGTQSIAFRGTSDRLYELDNGNFLKLVEAIAQFDLVLAEHLRRIKNQETQNKYLSKTIQNEIIDLISNSVKKKIITMIIEAKHFSIIVDSTPDKSRVEQVTLIIRFVHYEKNVFQIKEHFLGFLECKNKTGEGLTDLVLKALNDFNISINNCRGQGYDNGSNMKGKHSGMQNRIRCIEPRAFFVPCSSHSLNLVVNDSARCSLDAVKFFDIVQNLYVFVSSSTNRWDIYKKNVAGLTLKPLSDTRWESRIDALKPLKTSLGDIYEALIEISEDGNSEIKITAESLGNKIMEFQFICSILVWFDILEKINIASKYLQGTQINLSVGIQMLEHVSKCLVQMRSDEKFNEYLSAAEVIAIALDVPCRFPEQSSLRVRRKKKIYVDECPETVLDPKLSFKVNFYYKILDQAISSLNERFDQLKDHNSLFSFLHNISDAGKVNNLKDLCNNLEFALSNNGSKDIIGEELYQELINISPLIESNTSSLDVLNYIFSANLDQIFPNSVIALRILNTLPVTVASGERSFSKLKIIKNYLRTTMTQDRLVGLSLLAIEKELVNTLEYDDMVEEFAKLKARKVQFC